MNNEALNEEQTRLERLKTIQESGVNPYPSQTDRKMSLTSDQCLDIKLHYPTFPAKDFGCFQLSLQSNGIITGCCESNKPLGKNTDNPKNYINNFIKSLLPCIKCQKCNGCSDSSYFCGYQKEFSLSDCQNVVQLLTNI